MDGIPCKIRKECVNLTNGMCKWFQPF